MRIIYGFKTTYVTALIGILIWLVTYFFNVEVFEHLVALLNKLEQHEADEIALSAFLISIGLVIDLFILKKNREKHITVQKHRLRVLKSTMTTVQEIVNNFLDNIQLFRMEAEEKAALDPESVQLIDFAIFEIADKLRRIGDLESVPERRGPGGIYQIDIGVGQPNSTDSQPSREL